MPDSQVILIATVGNNDVTAGDLSDPKQAVTNAQQWLLDLQEKRRGVAAVTAPKSADLRFPIIEPACRHVIKLHGRIDKVVLLNTHRSAPIKPEPTLFSEILALGLQDLFPGVIDSVELLEVTGAVSLEEVDFFSQVETWFQDRNFRNSQVFVLPVGGMPHMQRAVTQFASLYCPDVVFLEKKQELTTTEVNTIPDVLTMVRDRYHFRELLRANDFSRASQLFCKSPLARTTRGAAYARELAKVEALFERGNHRNGLILGQRFKFSEEPGRKFQLLTLRFQNAYHLGNYHAAILLCSAILDELLFHLQEREFNISRSIVAFQGRSSGYRLMQYKICRSHLTDETIDGWIGILRGDPRNTNFIEKLKAQKKATSDWVFKEEIRIFEILLPFFAPMAKEIKDLYELIRFERNSAAHQGEAEVRDAIDWFLITFKPKKKKVTQVHFSAFLSWIDVVLGVTGPQVLQYPERFAELAERELMQLPMTEHEV